MLAYTFDALGRLKTQSGGGQNRTLIYDTCNNGKGLLCAAVKEGGATTTANFSYTPWGQLVTRQDGLGAATDTTSYSYDGMGLKNGTEGIKSSALSTTSPSPPSPTAWMPHKPSNTNTMGLRGSRRPHWPVAMWPASATMR